MMFRTLFERRQEAVASAAPFIAPRRSVPSTRSYQLDFVDVGLMPAVEGQVHLKLDRLLERCAHGIVCRLRPVMEPDTTHCCFAWSSDYSLRRSSRIAATRIPNNGIASNLRIRSSRDRIVLLPTCYPGDRSPNDISRVLRPRGTVSVAGSVSPTSHPTTWPFVYENTLVTQRNEKKIWGRTAHRTSSPSMR